MAYFAPHDRIIRHLERSTGRSDGQRLFDALVRRGLLKPWEGVEGYWGIEALEDETWRLLADSISPAGCTPAPPLPRPGEPHTS